MTTPDWPGAGSKAHPRKSDGNTLGCCDDDNSKALKSYEQLPDVSVTCRNSFSCLYLRLFWVYIKGPGHLESLFFAVLSCRWRNTSSPCTWRASRTRSRCCRPCRRPPWRRIRRTPRWGSALLKSSRFKIFKVAKLTSGPAALLSAAKQLGRPLRKDQDTLQGTLSVHTTKGPIKVIAKPSGLHVSPWHMVSALTATPLRTATWWSHPEIPSSPQGYKPGCWQSGLKSPVPEVQAAISGLSMGSMGVEVVRFI